MCECGHFGGSSPNTHQGHQPHFAEGHGSCNNCNCAQFTWVGFVGADGLPLPGKDTCKVVIKGNACGRESAKTYFCKIERADNGEIVEESIPVCERHIPAFEELYS